jgi:hypothetical protein
VRLAASPKDLLEGSDPVLLQVLKGISIDVKLNLWKKISDFVKKLGDSDFMQAMVPMLGMFAPIALLQVNAALNITVDEYMKQKIAENPLVEPVLMDA